MKTYLRKILYMAAFLAPASAFAAGGYTTANVNLRAGPGTDFYAVDVVPSYQPITIHGCLETAPWCDVSYDGLRGWLSSSYISFDYKGRRTTLSSGYYRQLSIPFVTFELGNYWDRHYHGRKFYRDRDVWYRRYHRRAAPPPVFQGYRPRPSVGQPGRPHPGVNRPPAAIQKPERPRPPFGSQIRPNQPPQQVRPARPQPPAIGPAGSRPQQIRPPENQRPGQIDRNPQRRPERTRP